MTDFHRVNASEGWQGGGAIPRLRAANASEQELECLSEDLVQLRTNCGTYALDIGWYPDADRSGGFVCRMVEADEWASPADTLETPDWEPVRDWLEAAQLEVGALLGREDEFGHGETIIFVISDATVEASIEQEPQSVDFSSRSPIRGTGAVSVDDLLAA